LEKKLLHFLIEVSPLASVFHRTTYLCIATKIVYVAK
jgi:hypothetical protein